MDKKIIPLIIISLLVLFNISSIIIKVGENISYSYNFKTINSKDEKSYIYLPIPSFPCKINKNIKKENSPYGNIYNISFSNNIDFHIKKDKYLIFTNNNDNIDFSTSERINNSSRFEIWVYQGQKENLTIEFEIEYSISYLSGGTKLTYSFLGNLTSGWNRIPLLQRKMNVDTFLCFPCLLMNIIINIVAISILIKCINKEKIELVTQMTLEKKNSFTEKNIPK